MGISLRNYLVEDDGSIKRISLKLSMSLEKGLKKLPEYAGKTVRIAEVALDLKDRKPFSILRIVGFKWHFDKNGSVKESHDKSVRLAFESFDFPEIEPLISEGDKNDVVIDITNKLNKKIYNDRFAWVPTPDETNKIINAIWKPKQEPKRKKSGKIIKFPVRK